MNKDDIRKPAASPVMRPVYSTNEDLMCGVINYNNRTYLVDLKDKDKLINCILFFAINNKKQKLCLRGCYSKTLLTRLL